MSVKVIQITIPSENILPDIINSFSPEENYQMLKIGCETLNEGRKSIAGLTQQEIYQKIKEEGKKYVEKLELDIIIERETSKKMEEKISKLYELQLEQLRKQISKMEEMNLILKTQTANIELENREIIQKEIEKFKDSYDLILYDKQEQLIKKDELLMIVKNKLKTIELENKELMQKEIEKYKDKYDLILYETQDKLIKKEETTLFLKSQLKTIELENKELIQKEIEKYKDKYDTLLEEKDKQNKLNREAFEKAEKLLNKNLYKSSKEKGNEGEDIFSNLSETFKDFNGYKIENKSKQGHKGDFHLYFKDFNVLVDSKNYTSNIQKKEVDKIKEDLITNDNVSFAWLVSLNSDICGWNRFNIMSDWIKAENGIKCVIFINNLLNEKDPSETLRLVWSICNDFNKFINNSEMYDEVELKKYKEKEIILNNKIRNLQNRSLEMKRNINNATNILKEMDVDLLELLTLVSNEIINTNIEKNKIISDWWEKNYEFTGVEGDNLISTDLWNKFKRDNKDNLENITIDLFKDKLMKLVGTSNYIEKNKKKFIEIVGYKQNMTEYKILPIEKIEVNLSDNILQSSFKTQYYFDAEKDKKILEEYNDIKNNIITISVSNKITPLQVVSLLMYHKIIRSRTSARGYNIYKKTDEYKQIHE